VGQNCGIRVKALYCFGGYDVTNKQTINVVLLELRKVQWNTHMWWSNEKRDLCTY